MNANLYWQIEQAEDYAQQARDFEAVIVELSSHKASVAALLEAYNQMILNAEYMWRDIEQSAEFQAKYTSRHEASANYYRIANAVPKDE